MDFWLTYRGELRSNGSVNHKHMIRKEFHSQIKELWNYWPLSYYSQPSEDGQIMGPRFKKVGIFNFFTLVLSGDSYVETDITMLRPEEPGGIISKGGDIDNRLKTLFDALRYPRNEKEIPPGETPNQDFNPFYCLLEDDSSISRVNVLTGRLLKPDNLNEVLLLIYVNIKNRRRTLQSSFLAE